MSGNTVTIRRKSGKPLNEAIKMLEHEHGELLSVLEDLKLAPGSKSFWGGGGEPTKGITFLADSSLTATFPPLGLNEQKEVHRLIILLSQYADDLELVHNEVTVDVSDLVKG